MSTKYEVYDKDIDEVLITCKSEREALDKKGEIEYDRWLATRGSWNHELEVRKVGKAYDRKN